MWTVSLVESVRTMGSNMEKIILDPMYVTLHTKGILVELKMFVKGKAIKL